MTKKKYAILVFVFQIVIWKVKLVYYGVVLNGLSYIIIPSLVVVLLIDFVRGKKDIFLIVFVGLNLLLFFIMYHLMDIAETSMVKQIKHTKDYIQTECCERGICPKNLTDWEVNSVPGPNPNQDYNKYILKPHYFGGFSGYMRVSINKNGQDFEFFYHYFDHAGIFYGGVNKCGEEEPKEVTKNLE